MEKSKAMKYVLMFLIMAFPLSVFGADDDLAIPIKETVVTWMKGNVGLTAAMIICSIGAIAGAFKGWGVFGNSLIYAVIIGGCIFLAEKAHLIGTGLGA